VGCCSCRWEQRLSAKAYRTESKPDIRAAARAPYSTEGVVWTLHCMVSICLPIAVPIIASWISDADPIPSSVLVMSALTLWMKLFSYACCNADYRCGSAGSMHH
jgi:hypothetical protein